MTTINNNKEEIKIFKSISELDDKIKKNLHWNNEEAAIYIAMNPEKWLTPDFIDIIEKKIPNYELNHWFIYNIQLSVKRLLNEDELNKLKRVSIIHDYIKKIF